MSGLDGKVALVTGATGAMGEAIADRLACDGATVVGVPVWWGGDARSNPTGGRALADGVPRLRERLAEAGRDPGDLEVIPFLTAAQADHRRIDALGQADATEIAFDIRPGDGETVRGELDRLAELVGQRRTLPPPAGAP